MNVEMIKELIEAFNSAQLTHLSLKCDELELKLGKEIKIVQAKEDIKRTVMMNDEDVDHSVETMGNPYERDQQTAQSRTDNKEKNIGYKTIKAPIVGTFYRSASPESKPFVEVGSYVHKGDVVCVVEAMKLMNEVEAEEEGEVVEILVENEEMVEYNQPLIVIK